MRKILSTVYFCGAILFGTCIAEGCQTAGETLPELRGAICKHLKEINKIINGKQVENVEDSIKEELSDTSAVFKRYRKMFFTENEKDLFEYVRSAVPNRDAQDQHVGLFNQFRSGVESIIKKGYLDSQKVDTILKSWGTSLYSLGLKNCLDMYTLFLASKYLSSFDDHVKFVLSSRRLRDNMEKFFYNPVELNKKTREHFPKIRTLYLYSENDETFDNDDKIIKREVWYPYDHSKERAENTTYHNLVLSRKYIKELFAGRTEILLKDWPNIEADVALDGCAFSEFVEL